MANIQLDVHPFMDRGRRDHQEDFFYTDPPPRDGVPWLAGVADGMGGHASGDVASKAGIHAMKKSFDEAVAGRRDTGQALVEAVTRGHEAVLAAAERINAVGNMGSTIVAFAIDGPSLHWCSAGDSRLYLCRTGKLQQLSRDFTLAEDMRKGAKKGDWSEEDIESSPQRNALTSFMGTDNWRHHEGKMLLQGGDVIVACSDGVYGTIDSTGIEAACLLGNGSASAQQIAGDMLKRVLDAGKVNQDNSTAVIVRLGGGRALTIPASSAKQPERGQTGGRERRASLALVSSGVGAVLLAVVVFALMRGPSAPTVSTGPAAIALAAASSTPPSVASTSPKSDAANEWMDQVTQLQDRFSSRKVPPERVLTLVADLRDRMKEQNIQETAPMSTRLNELLNKSKAVLESNSRGATRPGPQGKPTVAPPAPVSGEKSAANPGANTAVGQRDGTTKPVTSNPTERTPSANQAASPSSKETDKASSESMAGGSTTADEPVAKPLPQADDAASRAQANPAPVSPVSETQSTKKKATEARAKTSPPSPAAIAKKHLADKEAAARKAAAGGATTSERKAKAADRPSGTE